MFDWDNTAQTIIMSSFYWGYVVFQIPGGRMAELIGGKKVLYKYFFYVMDLTLVCLRRTEFMYSKRPEKKEARAWFKFNKPAIF